MYQTPGWSMLERFTTQIDRTEFVFGKLPLSSLRFAL